MALVAIFEEDLRKSGLILDVVSTLGYETVHAGNRGRGNNLADDIANGRISPSLVFMGFVEGFPGDSGIAWATQIHASSQSEQVAIVCIGEQHGPEWDAQIARPCFSRIVSPFNVDGITRVVERYLGRHALGERKE